MKKKTDKQKLAEYKLLEQKINNPLRRENEEDEMKDWVKQLKRQKSKPVKA